MSRTFNLNIANYLKCGSDPAALDFANPGSVFTLAAWVQIAQNNATDMTFLSLYNGSFGPLMRTISGKLRMFWIDSLTTGHEAIGATTMNTNQWYHVAATWPRSTSPGMQVWLNGVLDGTDATNGTMNTQHDTTNGWCAGIRGNGAGAKSFPLNGRMAEIGMWNTVLTAAEILALAKGTNPFMVRPGSLKAYVPVLGNQSPELDYCGQSGVSGLTVVGTLAQANHAPVGPQVPPAFALASYGE